MNIQLSPPLSLISRLACSVALLSTIPAHAVDYFACKKVLTRNFTEKQYIQNLKIIGDSLEIKRAPLSNATANSSEFLDYIFSGNVLTEIRHLESTHTLISIILISGSLEKKDYANKNNVNQFLDAYAGKFDNLATMVTQMDSIAQSSDIRVEYIKARHLLNEMKAASAPCTK